MINTGSLINIYSPKAGTILPWPDIAAPAGWLVCDGSAISRTTYKALFAAIGTTYGSGDGSTTFNLPNGNIPVGTNIKCLGNGVSIGLTDGFYYGGIVAASDSAHRTYVSEGNYGVPVGTVGAGGLFSRDQALGITADPTKSGIVASLYDSDIATKTIIKY